MFNFKNCICTPFCVGEHGEIFFFKQKFYIFLRTIHQFNTFPYNTLRPKTKSLEDTQRLVSKVNFKFFFREV